MSKLLNFVIVLPIVICVGLLPSLLFAEEIPTSRPEQVGLSGDKLAKAGEAIQKLVDDDLIEGMVVLVARHGRVAFHEAYGSANVSTSQPMTPDTIFRIYSMTKPVTSVATLILCERGIRTHETYTRNTLALAIVPEIKRVSRLPIIVDPSHGTGRRDLIPAMSNAAVACGADGLLIEVHGNPDLAWSDGDQSLDFKEIRELTAALRPFAEAARRTV